MTTSTPPGFVENFQILHVKLKWPVILRKNHPGSGRFEGKRRNGRKYMTNNKRRYYIHESFYMKRWSGFGTKFLTFKLLPLPKLISEYLTTLDSTTVFTWDRFDLEPYPNGYI